MTLARETFNERCLEVEQLLRYLEESEDPSSLSKPNTPKGETLRILRSSCYVMIYSMIESTMSVCLTDLASAVRNTATSIRELDDQIFARYLISKYNNKLITSSHDKGVSLAREFMDELDQRTIPQFSFAPPSGNCTENQIVKTLRGVGIELRLDPALNTRVKRKTSNDRTVIESLVQVRNDLAHGNRAFSEVGQDCTAFDLRATFELSIEFMAIVIGHFESYIEASGYLK
ncbi:hypothetical protein HLB23_39515 [Nocardia uniformis]|uniref:MAE-28990/MAE-18760-like HEPN domain-containing protein n=1 Tax=Nocardia uniformis TaxID=53432 RepID=A0A849CD51_9NOCA|nr:MAE_28990/MAE_18760 family HEPN-like nuclease [Nocardia uniformis]NNH75876.1 hypothetical protein [Nocardia uniformis]